MVNWRKVIRVLHRDLGYFFFGTTIVYAVSGVLLNHIRQWNSNYEITVERSALRWTNVEAVTEPKVRELLGQIGETHALKSFYAPAPDKLKIFFDSGVLDLNTQTGEANIERVRRRPVLFELNFLHYNPGRLWQYFSDSFCAALLILSITGLFLVRGKYGLKGRGGWLTGLGIAIPAVLLIFYL
jgi:hypothetical protein